MLSGTQYLTPTPGTPTSSGNAIQHRLLYRGALSLPDSYLLLDGLSFVAETRSALQGSPAANLLSNPLTLALESMRGRPSLHLIGTERLQDVWLDSKANISVYIHPLSTLTQLYFQNILCLDEITDEEKRTNLGVRVSLTEHNEPETSDFLIYGQLVPAEGLHEEPIPSASTTVPTVLQMYAARILTAPPPSVSRIPRPDDPTPRKPPAYLLNGNTKRKRESSNASLGLGNGIKRSKSGRDDADEDEQVIIAREVMLRGPQVGHLAKPSREKSQADIFKIPSLPSRSASLSRVDASSQLSMDVFGSVGTVKPKGKDGFGDHGSTELEKANKTVIKQAAVTCLGNHGLTRGPPEFNELYQALYRGVTFALRSIMRIQAVDIRIVERLLESHARMYVQGNGENHSSEGTAK